MAAPRRYVVWRCSWSRRSTTPFRWSVPPHLRQQILQRQLFSPHPTAIHSHSDIGPSKAPPVWKVRMVSCVPGSPMLCAAMVPLGWPIAASLPGVERSSPQRCMDHRGTSYLRKTDFSVTYPRFSVIQLFNFNSVLECCEPPSPSYLKCVFPLVNTVSTRTDLHSLVALIVSPGCRSRWRKFHCVVGRSKAFWSSHLEPEVVHFDKQNETTWHTIDIN